eukprot:Awhi_evm1s14067
MAQNEEVEGQFTDDSAFDLDLAQAESLAWVEAVLQEKLASNENFWSGLRDGQRLCRFVNCIKPGAVRRINKSKSPFPSMENLESFLGACRGIGLKDTTLFTASSFHGGSENEGMVGNAAEAQAKSDKKHNKILRDVCINIYWLGVAVRAMPDYKGPQLNLAAFMKLACTRCQTDITDNDYVVAGGRQFHNKCFNCDTCKKDPVDPNENFKWDNYNEHLSCAKCRCVKCKECVLPNKYRSLDESKPVGECDKICPACDTENKCTACKTIVDPENHHVHDSKKYCPDCICSDEECQKPFVNNKFGIVDGKKFCPDCLCNNCNQLAGPDHVVKNNKKICPQCYCADDTCKKPFVNNKYKEIEGKRFCPDCLCTNCENLAGEDFITTPNNKKVCKDCYCADEECKKPFKNNEFKEVDGKRFCPDCLCSNCDDLAGPDHIKQNGKKFCPKCYCHDEECKKPFKNNEFKEVDGERYCPDCLCNNCEELAGPDHVKKDGKKYCPQCYCGDEECKKPFVNNEFKEIEGTRYCPDCLCHNCEELAGPDHVKENGKKFCPQCYCADKSCSKPFVNNEFKEVDGKRYCPDCMCHKEGCDNWAGDDPMIVDGKKYCPHCVCADDDCHKPLVDGEFVSVAACADIPNGGNVCKDCLCALCDTFVGKNFFIRRKGQRFCNNCACGGCKIPLRDNTLPRLPTKNNPKDHRFCKNCVCTACDAGIGRKDKRAQYAGKQYCYDCVCVHCHKAFTGRLEEGKVEAKDGFACVDCQCYHCHEGLATKDSIKYGHHKYCKKCLCHTCGKPSTDKRGELTSISGKYYCSHCLCTTCEVPLPKDHVEHGDFSYCKKCVCGSCSDPVSEETKTMKGPKAYCPRCVCVQCSTVVTEGKYVEFADYVTCLRCACARCGRPEKPAGAEPEEPFKKAAGKAYCTSCICECCEAPLNEDQNNYCDDCTCTTCGCVLDDDEADYCGDCGKGKPGYKSRDQVRADKKAGKAAAAKPAASKPAGRPAPKAASSPASQPKKPAEKVEGHDSGCYKCGGDLFGSVVKALDQQFHKDCFVCFGCEGTLSAGFMAHEGSPYCKTCIGKAAGHPDCNGCGSTVSGSFLSLGDDMNWHADCFKCTLCMKTLDGNSFGMKGSDPCCKG